MGIPSTTKIIAEILKIQKRSQKQRTMVAFSKITPNTWNDRNQVQTINLSTPSKQRVSLLNYTTLITTKGEQSPSIISMEV